MRKSNAKKPNRIRILENRSDSYWVHVKSLKAETEAILQFEKADNDRGIECGRAYHTKMANGAIATYMHIYPTSDVHVFAFI